MRKIIQTTESNGRTIHLLEGGGEVHVHDGGDVWLYPQVKFFISLEDALAYVA